MSQSSWYALNQRLNSLASRVSNIPVPPVPPDAYATLASNQTFTGLNTFLQLPESSAIPISNNQLVNKLYVDSVVPPADTLQQVLTADNVSDLSIILQDTLVAPTNVNTISNASVFLTGTGILTPSSIFTNTIDKQSLTILDIDASVPIQKTAFFRDYGCNFYSADTGQNASLTLQLDNVFGTGLTHFDNYAVPAPLVISTTTSNLNLLSSVGDINLNTPSGVVNINGTPYPPVVPADTLQQVLTAGNTANIGFQLNAGAGANTQSPTTIILDAQSLISPLALASNTLTNTSLTIKDDEPSAPNNDTTSLAITNDNIQYFNRVPFGYTNQLDITLSNPTGTGITHIDNFPTPSPFTIDTNTSLILKATNTAGFTPYGINIDAGTPNIWYDLDPTFGGSSRVEITNQGAISSVHTTAQQFGVFQTSNLFLNNANTQRNMTLNQDAITFASSASPSLNSTHTISTLIFNDVAGVTPISAQLNTTSLTITNTNQGTSIINAGQATISKASAGGQANPTLLLNNTNATGSVALEVYKAKPTAGLAGEVLFNQSVYGKDSGNNKQEYTRITHTIRDPIAGVEDGSIEMGAFVNGTFTNFLQINGNENEINALRPLDMTGNNIRTTTGSLAINVASSATAGAVLTLATKDNVAGSGAGLSLTGDTLLSATASGSSGQHLCLTIGGVVYKIALLNP